MRKLIFTALFLGITIEHVPIQSQIAGSSESVQWKDAEKFIKDRADEALKTLRNPNKEEFLNYFVQTIKKHFDLDRMVKMVLGKYRRNFTDAQIQTFLSFFINMVVKLYASNFEAYKNAKVAIVGVSEQKKGTYLVTTKIIIEGKPDTTVVWSVSASDGALKIRDVLMGGISLLIILQANIQNRISELHFKIPEYLKDCESEFGNLHSDSVTSHAH